MSHLKIGNCRLCGKRNKLMKSHFVPKWVGKWLKETSATGYMRMPHNPNLRVQDLPTRPLFCSSCEKLLSKDEQAFKERLFLPKLAGHHPLEYGEWFLRFAVSLAFRTICYYEVVDPETDILHAADLRGASYRWQRFLLGKEETPGIGKNHVISLDIVTDNPQGLRRDLNSFLLRSISVDILKSSNRIIVVTKLPWFLFASEVSGLPLTGWSGTLIARAGVLPDRQTIEDDALAEYITEKARYVRSRQEAMSRRQQEIVVHEALRNPVRTDQSQSMFLHRLDRDL